MKPKLQFLLATGGSKMVVLSKEKKTEVYTKNEPKEGSILSVNKILDNLKK
ncbi:hypothetical protein Dip510_000734 [Elusimicrobium posterum]|uniref:hypothetical protein n=1 Tax=Elusimicrobium posterum TaxID=3116653 RepID=UPI003C71CDD6